MTDEVKSLEEKFSLECLRNLELFKKISHMKFKDWENIKLPKQITFKKGKRNAPNPI